LKGLIVTADDFGASSAVNNAIEMAHRSGILRAASLMVSAPAAYQAVDLAKRLPSLRVGLHLVLVEGRPTLSASAVSRLVDASGAFRCDLAGLGALIAFSRQARRQLAAEITAQFAAFVATGLTLDHCNAHKHFHLHPTVGRMMLSIGRRFGLRAVRVPLEAHRVLRTVEPRTARLPTLATAPFAHWLRHRVREAGVLAPDQVFGLQWSGQMTKSRLVGLIRNLPDGLSEVYLHPATGHYAGDAPGYLYREELQALVDPEVIAACRDEPLRMGGFEDFQMSAPARSDASCATVPSEGLSR
jgi:hopanoid biosynthesis associated protein HpnK